MSIHKTATNTPVGCAEERSASIANDALHAVQHILRDIPKSWEIKKIKEFAHTTSGGTPKRSNSEYFGGNIPWVKSGDLNDGMLFECEENITEQGLNNSSAKLFKAGTLLIALYGATIGRLSILNFEAATNQAVCGISVPDNVDVKYLFYFLLNSRRNLIEQGKGGAQPNINQYIVNEIEVPLAPFDQQKQIVAKIEELFSHIDAGVIALQKAKQLLKQYRQSVLKAAVTGELTREWREQNKDDAHGSANVAGGKTPGATKLEPASELLKRILAERRSKWEKQQLEQFKAQGKVPKDDKWKLKYKEPKPASIFNNLKYPDEWELASIDQLAEVLLGKMLDKSKHTTGKLLPYLRNINVRWGNVVTDDLLQMYFESHELDRYGVQYGDVLVCEGGEPGRAAVWDKDNISMLYQKALHRVRFYEPLTPKYLTYLLEYYALTGFLELYFTGSTIKHFTKESFITLPFPLPSKNEIEAIVLAIDSKLESSSRLSAAIDIQLIKAEKNKQSILAAAFSGRLIYD